VRWLAEGRDKKHDPLELQIDYINCSQREEVRQREEAERRARIALSRQLSAQSITHLDRQYDLALLLSLEACRIDDNVEARSSLVTALQNKPHIETLLYGHLVHVAAVVFSPDGKQFASGDEDGVILLWDRTMKSPWAGIWARIRPNCLVLRSARTERYWLPVVRVTKLACGTLFPESPSMSP
jgi:WD40 repeat protein